MIQEYQVIEHNYYRGLNLFLSKLFYRAPHYHRECELMMALEGEAEITFSNGKGCHLSEGNITVIGPMVMHEIRAGKNGVLLITVHTSFAMLEYFLSHRISPFLTADTDISPFMSREEQDSLKSLCLKLALSYPGMPEDDAGECFGRNLVKFLQESNSFKILPATEFVWKPLSFFPAEIKIDHRRDCIHTNSVDMEFLDPVEGIESVPVISLSCVQGCYGYQLSGISKAEAF